MADIFDAIVIGAGVMGSAAAYHLAKQGRRALLLEQFEIGHSHASSHGESRIFRFAYDNAEYAKLAMQCKPLWRELEREAGETLLLDSSQLDLTDEPAHHKDVLAVANTLAQIGASFEQLDAAQLRQRYPQWRLGNAAIAVKSPDSGILRATRCVQSLVAQAVQHGATVRECEAMTKIEDAGDEVQVTTSKDVYRARKLIVAGGAWLNGLLAHIGLSLPLKVTQEQVVYFKPLANEAAFERGAFPIFIHWRSHDVGYGFPIIGARGVKIGFHHDHYEIDPNGGRAPRNEVTQRLLAYAQRYLPDAAGAPFEPTACIYTTTPDEDFVVDVAPAHPNVIVSSSCSGHGFKFGIGIGRALADLALRGETEMNIGHIRWRRF
jgi:monomeric sarcosine oxidase